MTQSSYKISLITPVYNAGAYLREAFASVRNQTIGFEQIEWLLVDDCSSDGSFALMKSWAAQYPNVKALRTPANTGTPAEPRNVGLAQASAPYVMFLDNDDVLFPDAMKALYDEIERSGADIITGDVALLNKSEFTKEERKQLLNYTEQAEYGLCTLCLPLEKSIEPYLNNHWCKIYRREIIARNRIRSLKGELWEDILFLFQYMAFVKTMVHIPQPIVKYRVRRESLSHVYNRRFYCSLPKSIEYGLRHMESFGREQAQTYMAFFEKGGHIEYYTDCLLNDEKMTGKEIEDCVLAWKPCFLAAIQYGGAFHSAYCRILADDFADGRDDKALFHFFALKELYKQRQEEKNNILSSNSYRLAAKLAGIKSALTGDRG